MLLNLQLLDNTETQAEIDVFCEWCDENEVQINTDKCCCLHSSDNNNTLYHCGNTPISTVTSFKDLGDQPLEHTLCMMTMLYLKRKISDLLS